MKKIVVTGGSGKAGHATIKELVEHGYDVLNVDLVPPRERLSPHLKTDLNELGQVFEVLQDADAVIHLGAIPAPDLQPPESIFRHNTLSTYNVFSAAVSLKLQKVVWASSIYSKQFLHSLMSRELAIMLLCPPESSRAARWQ